MIQLDLKKEEQDILIEVLDICISDLRMEIADTDKMDFRESLRQRKNVLKKVLESLKSQ
jgi:hypothetical protein